MTDAPPPPSARFAGLRTLAALILLLGPLVAGLVGRPPLTGLVFLGAYVVVKAITRWSLWSSTIAERGWGVLPAMVTATVVVQSVVVAVLFGAGSLVGHLSGYRWPSEAVGGFDLALVSGTALAHLVLRGVTRDER